MVNQTPLTVAIHSQCPDSSLHSVCHPITTDCSHPLTLNSTYTLVCQPNTTECSHPLTLQTQLFTLCVNQTPLSVAIHSHSRLNSDTLYVNQTPLTVAIHSHTNSTLHWEYVNQTPLTVAIHSHSRVNSSLYMSTHTDCSHPLTPTLHSTYMSTKHH